MTGPGVTTQERLLEDVVALCGVFDQDVPRGFAGQIREPRTRGAEEEHQGDEGEGGEKESREKET